MKASGHLAAPAAALLILWISACSRKDSDRFQGYIEGEYVYPAAPVPGILVSRPVARGDPVRVGDLLFVLESDSERAAGVGAERRLAETQARVDDLLKGRRPTELEALKAHVEEERASLVLWEA